MMLIWDDLYLKRQDSFVSTTGGTRGMQQEDEIPGATGRHQQCAGD